MKRSMEDEEGNIRARMSFRSKDLLATANLAISIAPMSISFPTRSINFTLSRLLFFFFCWLWWFHTS